MPAPLPAAAAGAASNVRPEDVFYPCSDGRPMADNMWQADAILNATGDLRAAHPKALVAADMLVYPEEGNRHNRIAPDVLVAFGIGTHKRSSYRVWEEGKPPDWVLEVASPSTEAKDRRAKGQTYAAMGVPEFWLFDAKSPQRGARGTPSHEKGDVYPRGTPLLQGFELVDGEYRPLPSRLVDGERMIRSKVLGLDVRAEGELLRFRDPATGEDIGHRPEIEAAMKQAQAAAQRAEAQARQEAASRKTAETQAEREAARASEEAAARSAAEARVAELEAALRSRDRDRP